MRSVIAPVKNIAAFEAAFEALCTRDPGVPGMGLVHGYTGSGKSTAVAWIVNRSKGVYARALGTWTPSSMLAKLMTELGAAPLQRSAQMVEFVSSQLRSEGRPLFIDEANYIATEAKMLDTLRDIHDISEQPVILVGHEGTERRIAHRAQLARRISQCVEFKPLDVDDTELLARTVCEVAVDADLLRELHEQARGSIGLMTMGLARVEALAKAQCWSEVTADDWRGRPFFLGTVAAGPRA